ncbi:MAG: hypothetical protein IJ484_06015 [Oscillospiraceae bacterium]|nr:hypothetical protein [Oscillospiraceae bacterium]
MEREKEEFWVELPLRPQQQACASKSDPLGSWTGVPEDPYEVPVQDADDL